MWDHMVQLAISRHARVMQASSRLRELRARDRRRDGLDGLAFGSPMADEVAKVGCRRPEHSGAAAGVGVRRPDLILAMQGGLAEGCTPICMGSEHGVAGHAQAAERKLV